MGAVVIALCGLADAKDHHGAPLPPGSRSFDASAAGAADKRTRDLFVSGRGFRKSVQHVQRQLRRRGIAHKAVPIYRHRGTTVARFVSQHGSTGWCAVQVYRTRGKTFVFVVPRSGRKNCEGPEPAK